MVDFGGDTSGSGAIVDIGHFLEKKKGETTSEVLHNDTWRLGAVSNYSKDQEWGERGQLRVVISSAVLVAFEVVELLGQSQYKEAPIILIDQPRKTQLEEMSPVRWSRTERQLKG